MRKWLLLLALASMYGCVSLPAYMERPQHFETHGSQVERLSGHHLIELEYKPASVLHQEAEHEATQRRAAPRTGHIAPGGMLLVRFYTGTIGAADPKHWELIVTDDAGTEIQRKRGQSAVPSYTSVHGAAFWFGSVVTLFREPMSAPFRVVVYDEISQHSSEFRVVPPL